jgi:HD-GYP domain-containing protein (c-di-GMP phosphodiesterase class II)
MLWEFLSRIRRKLNNDHVVVELLLIGSALALAAMLAAVHANKVVVLNLFYLPVILGGFFLGRYRAGIMALLCVIAASLALAQSPSEFAGSHSVVVVGLSMLIWGAVLCLAALLVGSLSDERNAKVRELHEAYVGVVEVLSKYLQSANPKLKDRATRVAELCQKVAAEMRLPSQEIDDIRVAALMLDLGKIEVTTRLVSRAVDTLESNPEPLEQHSFHGIDLVQSLGSVLKGAIPLLASQGDAVFGAPNVGCSENQAEQPIGARIIRMVRIYDAITAGGLNQTWRDPREALAELDIDESLASDAAIRVALERSVLAGSQSTRQFASAGQLVTSR